MHDIAQLEKTILPLVQKQCDIWIQEQDSPHISTMYAAIHQGKMLRSKLVIAIVSTTLHAMGEKAVDMNLDSSRLDSSVDSQNTPESTPESARARHNTKSIESIIDSVLCRDVIKLCAVIECIQCASLLHDDVIDAATTRRGGPSVNASFGDKNAIMLGDVLYAKAFVELCGFHSDIAKTIAQSVCLLSKGEIEDVAYSTEFQPDLSVYYKILRNKTASLIAASAKAAALLSGLDSSKYESYGYNLGMAFQIVDDILDITQDEKTLGKPAMHDIQEGKSTLPYILLYQTLEAQEQEEFLQCFANASSANIARIRAMLLQSNALQRAKTIAQDFITSALDSIQSESNPTLESIAKALIERSY